MDGAQVRCSVEWVPVHARDTMGEPSQRAIHLAPVVHDGSLETLMRMQTSHDIARARRREGEIAVAWYDGKAAAER